MFLSQKLITTGRAQEETFGSAVHVGSIDCGDGSTDVDLPPNSPRCIHYIRAALCMSNLPPQSG